MIRSLRLIGLPQSMRLRLTVIATCIVGITLIAAAAALVISLNKSLTGQTRSEASKLIAQASTYLEKGEPLPPELTRDIVKTGMTIEIRDSAGRVITALPDLWSSVPDPTVILNGQPITNGVLGINGRRDSVATNVDGGDFVIIKRLAGANQVIVGKEINTPEGSRQIVAITPLAIVAKSVDATTKALLVITPILILFVAIVTWRLTGRALSPIESLRSQADTISHATLSERLPVPSTGDEVERLALTLNDMLERLDNASRLQREFVSDASHELRSPLAAMQTALEVARLHPDSTETPLLYDGLLKELQRVESLVSSLLQLAQLDDGQAVVTFEPINIAELIQSAADDSVELDLSPVTLDGNAQQLDSAVRNLLDNAKRYANSKVSVSVKSDAESVIICVDDDGPGIPAEERERVFERFARLDEGRSRRSGGAGIGLALVKRIVELHHGTVTIGESPTGGARLQIQLPANH